MKLLTSLSGTKGTDEIRWNFCKFLVDKEGNVVDRFEPVLTVKDYKEEILKYLA